MAIVATTLSVHRMKMVALIALMIAVMTAIAVIAVIVMMSVWILWSQCFLVEVEVEGDMEVIKDRILSGLVHLKPIWLHLVVIMVEAITMGVISSAGDLCKLRTCE